MSYYQLSQLGYKREVIVKDSMCIFKGQLKLDGILGGYRLVSTYSNYQNPRGGGGGRVFWKVKTQSAKICLNFNFRGEGGVLESQNPKYQDLPIFQFFLCVCVGGGAKRGSVLENQNPNCQDLPKISIWGGGAA